MPAMRFVGVLLALPYRFWLTFTSFSKVSLAVLDLYLLPLSYLHCSSLFATLVYYS